MTQQIYTTEAERPQHKRYLPIILKIAIFLLVQVAILYMLGRDWSCACGTFRLWQGTLDPAQNSQQLSDPYSLLHMIFGFAVFLWLRLIRPLWSLRKRTLIAVICSAIWEIIENLPFMVRQFGAEGSNLHYFGDSIINSIGDTGFVLLGFLLASRLPGAATLGLAVLAEVAVYLLIGDSISVGAYRLVTGS
jgi:hypothetical protein